MRDQSYTRPHISFKQTFLSKSTSLRLGYEKVLQELCSQPELVFQNECLQGSIWVRDSCTTPEARVYSRSCCFVGYCENKRKGLCLLLLFLEQQQKGIISPSLWKYFLEKAMLAFSNFPALAWTMPHVQHLPQFPLA